MNEDDLKLARFISEDEATLQALILIKYNIPFDVAFSLPDVQRFAYVVAVKTMFEPVYFDWEHQRWKEKTAPQSRSM